MATAQSKNGKKPATTTKGKPKAKGTAFSERAARAEIEAATPTRWPTNECGIPVPPEHLSEQAQGYWRMINGEYALEDASLLVLQTSLEHWDRARECSEIIKRDGLMILDRFGAKREHPLLAAERTSKAKFADTLGRLGLDLEPLNPSPGRPSGY